MHESSLWVTVLRLPSLSILRSPRKMAAKPEIENTPCMAQRNCMKNDEYRNYGWYFL